MRVVHEQKVSVPVAGQSLDLILGVYEAPIIGRFYMVRSPMSNIVSVGILPNDITDQEAIALASRIFERTKSNLQNYLMYREGDSVVPLLEKVGHGNTVEASTEPAGSDEEEGGEAQQRG